MGSPTLLMSFFDRLKNPFDTKERRGWMRKEWWQQSVRVVAPVWSRLRLNSPPRRLRNSSSSNNNNNKMKSSCTTSCSRPPRSITTGAIFSILQSPERTGTRMVPSSFFSNTCNIWRQKICRLYPTRVLPMVKTVGLNPDFFRAVITWSLQTVRTGLLMWRWKLRQHLRRRRQQQQQTKLWCLRPLVPIETKRRSTTTRSRTRQEEGLNSSKVICNFWKFFTFTLFFGILHWRIWFGFQSMECKYVWSMDNSNSS